MSPSGYVFTHVVQNAHHEITFSKTGLTYAWYTKKEASTHRSHKSQNASVPYPTIYHMCTFLFKFQSGILRDIKEVHCGICEFSPVWNSCFPACRPETPAMVLLSSIVANTHASTDNFYHICFLTDNINTKVTHCLDHEPQYKAWRRHKIFKQWIFIYQFCRGVLLSELVFWIVLQYNVGKISVNERCYTCNVFFYHLILYTRDLRCTQKPIQINAQH